VKPSKNWMGGVASTDLPIRDIRHSTLARQVLHDEPLLNKPEFVPYRWQGRAGWNPEDVEIPSRLQLSTADHRDWRREHAALVAGVRARLAGMSSGQRDALACAPELSGLWPVCDACKAGSHCDWCICCGSQGC
jgi:hypothetical protein